MSDIFDLDAAYAEVVKEPFTFRYGGRQWQLPHLVDIDFRVASLGDDLDIAAIKDLLALGFSEDDFAAFEKLRLPSPALTLLVRRWVQHSGMEPGESPASDGSSKSTGRPSKRTSRTTTASASRKRSTARTA